MRIGWVECNYSVVINCGHCPLHQQSRRLHSAKPQEYPEIERMHISKVIEQNCRFTEESCFLLTRLLHRLISRTSFRLPCDCLCKLVVPLFIPTCCMSLTAALAMRVFSRSLGKCLADQHSTEAWSSWLLCASLALFIFLTNLHFQILQIRLAGLAPRSDIVQPLLIKKAKSDPS